MAERARQSVCRPESQYCAEVSEPAAVCSAAVVDSDHDTFSCVSRSLVSVRRRYKNSSQWLCGQRSLAPITVAVNPVFVAGVVGRVNIDNADFAGVRAFKQLQTVEVVALNELVGRARPGNIVEAVRVLFNQAG